MGKRTIVPMLKRLLTLVIVTQMLLISVWANAHMSAEPHLAYESVHIHIDSSFDNQQHDHSSSSESEEHESHVHLCFCALDFSQAKQLPQLIHSAPFSIELALISHLQSPPTPPPTV